MKSIGHYQMLEKLGHGGMGVVYKARDTRLDRVVALKVLPPERIADQERKRRFLQEARAASALNHPNIVTIYDVVEDGGAQCIVMEYVEGPRLDDVIGRGLKAPEVLGYAIQAADALSRAHAAGIVHRDLKPANIMVTGDGRVKVLDFGLAKLIEPSVSGPLEPTQTLGCNTAEGTILGTVSYMSPEQAEGRKVDARSDIFSFGAVLYEMVTGRRAFEGGSPLSTLSAILKDDPTPAGQVATGVPPELDKIIARCLRKDPARRIQLMEDVKLALEDVKEEEAALRPALEKRPSRRAWWLAPAGSALATAALVFLFSRPSGTDLTAYRFTPLATEVGEEGAPAWSPDGKSIAYVAEVSGVRQILTRGLEAPGSAQLTRSTSDCRAPFWSHNGSQIHYVSQGQLWSVGAAGGAAHLLVKNVISAGLSPNGKTLIFVRGTTGNAGLWTVSLPDAEPQRYRHAPFPETFATANPPDFSPDGTKIAVLVAREAGAARPELWVVPQPAGSPRRVHVSMPSSFYSIQRISWMPDSRHVVLAGDGLGSFASRLYVADTQSGRLWPVTAGAAGEWDPAVSPDGHRIAFVTGVDDFDVVEFALDGAGRRELLVTSRSEQWPAWSPAGNQYAYVTNARLASELWLRGVQEGWSRPVLERGGAAETWYRLQRPRFSPDGHRVAYDVYGAKHAVWISTVAGGRPVALDAESPDQHGPSWSPDGNWIAYRRLNAGKWELMKAPLGGGTRVFLAETTQAGADTDWSPSGEWICHPKGGTLELVSADGREKRSLGTGGTAFGFSRDGSLLYVIRRGPDRRWKLVSLEVPSGKEKRQADMGLPLSASISGLSVHPDGKRFATSVGYNRHDIWVMEGFPQPSGWWSRLRDLF